MKAKWRRFWTITAFAAYCYGGLLVELSPAGATLHNLECRAIAERTRRMTSAQPGSSSAAFGSDDRFAEVFEEFRRRDERLGIYGDGPKPQGFWNAALHLAFLPPRALLAILPGCSLFPERRALSYRLVFPGLIVLWGLSTAAANRRSGNRSANERQRA
ncbi:MAG: hypothetical protein IPM29_04605 [Planctomycetes bacterium]|nr:hypothetical protein [Planctomycetota bacterium]